MEKYKLIVKRSVAGDLRAIPRKDVVRIVKCFEAIRENPRATGCEKLSGRERYRMRSGVSRIIYEIQDNVLTVLVVKVGHRRDVYEKI